MAEGSVLEESARKNPDSGSLGLANVLEGSMACELKELIPKSSHLGGSTGPLVALDTGVRMAVPPESVQDNWHRDQDQGHEDLQHLSLTVTPCGEKEQ